MTARAYVIKCVFLSGTRAVKAGRFTPRTVRRLAYKHTVDHRTTVWDVDGSKNILVFDGDPDGLIVDNLPNT